ncbi:MAG: FtsW/RodA/SpoVE family cell cycle protein, partial [Lachnospirales bacterium]
MEARFEPKEVRVTDTLLSLPQTILDALHSFLAQHPAVAGWYTTVVRFLFPILALLILVGAIRSLLTVPHLPEVWGYLSLPNGAGAPLTHWENILGRSASADVVLEYPTISRQHAALIRDPRDCWTVYDLGSKGGILVNGARVEESAPLRYGDVLSLGGVETVLLPVSPEEKAQRRERRRKARPVSPWGSLLLLTVFQVLTGIQLTISEGGNAAPALPFTFLALTLLMWAYFLTLRAFRRVGFEMELIAFFLSTLSLSVVASSNTPALPKQFLCVVLGLVMFLVLGAFLRDLERAKKIRWLMAGAAIGLLGITLVLGSRKFGATNWISIGGMSLQPSELAKICYIFAGSATLDRLFRKRNLTLFIVLTGACLGFLALMSDFGTAAIFFVTFLVIAYLRSGDWATLGLITGGAVGG